MERRYGREQKYHVKIKKKKTPLECVVLRQSIICAVLIAVGAVVSYADIGGFNKSFAQQVLYKTGTFEEIKDTVIPVFKKAKKETQKTVLYLKKQADALEDSLGIKSKETAPVEAKADKKPKKKAEEKEPEKQVQMYEPELRLPTIGEVTSDFGSRVHPISQQNAEHTGIDLAAPAGQTVISAAKGSVRAVGYDDANGHYVVIEHTGNLSTVYAHLLKACVVTGEIVDDNTKIGEVGSSGISTGPHLHFEIKLNGESVNPRNYIEFN